MSNLSEEEPQPIINNYPFVWDLVMKDMQERDQMGQERYHCHLQPFNGRNSLIDLYQELLDAVVYLRQLLYEINGK